MRPDYPKWLAERYADNTKIAQINRVQKVEKSYGNLDEHFANGTYEEVINALKYSRADERAKKPNPSKIKFNGDIRNNLQSYKNAVVRYQKFLKDSGSQRPAMQQEGTDEITGIPLSEESNRQRLSLERDMQNALRLNIASLDPSLKIIDDGSERAVDSGLIDITCDDGNALVVVEIKAGHADSRAIGQILGYMEEDGRSVRGILVAHDFDKRTKAAARVVPTLSLRKYSIEFKFTKAD